MEGGIRLPHPPRFQHKLSGPDMFDTAPPLDGDKGVKSVVRQDKHIPEELLIIHRWYLHEVVVDAHEPVWVIDSEGSCREG